MNKKVLFLLFIFIIFSQIFFVNAAVNATNPLNAAFSPDIATRQVIQSEQNIKQYFDNKFSKFIDDATAKAQGFLDANFLQLDNTIRSEVQKYYIKAEIGLIAGLFFAAMLITLFIMIMRKWLNMKAKTERKVILEWLEAHEAESLKMKETIKEMEDFINLFKGITKNSFPEVPKPPIKSDEELLKEFKEWKNNQ
jgi:hypothetical protein